jgi:hypothetical protein
MASGAGRQLAKNSPIGMIERAKQVLNPRPAPPAPPPLRGEGLFCPLDHVDWGIFGQLATRATGHLGFGVFAAKQCLWHGG